MFDSYKSIFRHRHPHEGWKWTWKYFSQWFSLEFEEDYIQYWNIIYYYFFIFFFGSSWNSYLVAPALKFNGRQQTLTDLMAPWDLNCSFLLYVWRFEKLVQVSIKHKSPRPKVEYSRVHVEMQPRSFELYWTHFQHISALRSGRRTEIRLWCLCCESGPT